MVKDGKVKLPSINPALNRYNQNLGNLSTDRTRWAPRMIKQGHYKSAKDELSVLKFARLFLSNIFADKKVKITSKQIKAILKQKACETNSHGKLQNYRFAIKNK